MKLSMTTLWCLCLVLLATTTPTNAFYFSSISTAIEAPPVEKGKLKKKRKFKKKKHFKKHRLSPKKNRKTIAIILIVSGVVAVLLSLLLLFFLVPSIGIIVGGIVAGVSKYLGWISFAILSFVAILLIWIGCVFLNYANKTPTTEEHKKKAIHALTKKYSRVPKETLKKYALLEDEIAELKKERIQLKEEFSKENKEKLQLVEVQLERKEADQKFLERLNTELEEVSITNRTVYTALKEEIHALNAKQLELETSDADVNEIEAIKDEIAKKQKQLEALK